MAAFKQVPRPSLRKKVITYIQRPRHYIQPTNPERGKRQRNSKNGGRLASRLRNTEHSEQEEQQLFFGANQTCLLLGCANSPLE